MRGSGSGAAPAVRVRERVETVSTARSLWDAKIDEFGARAVPLRLDLYMTLYLTWNGTRDHHSPQEILADCEGLQPGIKELSQGSR